MKRFYIFSFITLCLNSIAIAQTGEVYLCVDENGKKEYKNNGAVKGCKKVDLPGITIIPGYTPPAGAKKSGEKGASSPSDFPRVDESAQKSRDSDRKLILQDELKNEEAKLASLKKDFNNGEPERLGSEKNYAKYQERVGQMKEEISRVEKNIEALKREIGNIK